MDETSFKGSLPARGAAKHAHPAAVARQQQPVLRAQLASRCAGRSSFCSVKRCKTLELGPAACEVAKLRIGRGVAGEKFALCRRWSPGAERLHSVGAREAVHCGSQRQETPKQHRWRRHPSVCLAPQSVAVADGRGPSWPCLLLQTCRCSEHRVHVRTEKCTPKPSTCCTAVSRR